MKGYDLVANAPFYEDSVPTITPESQLFIICNAKELYRFLDIFNWDKDTVDTCANLDEKIRFTNYDNYDFISLIFADTKEFSLIQHEVNVFFSSTYMAVVLPEHPGPSLTMLERKLIDAIPSAIPRKSPLAHMYYVFFDNLASFYTDALEQIENKMESIEITPDKEQLKSIVPLRKMAYTYRKLLRALSYVGDQVLMDEHDFLDDSLHRYFRDIDTRLSKLYDFADSLYVSSNDLINIHDSKASAQMNETVSRLTMITLFFAPPTLIAGIYGMNFDRMPELSWYFGYPLAIAGMFGVSLLIYLILKKNKWL